MENLAEIASKIDSRKLFVSMIRFLGLNAWIQFYYHINDDIVLVDIALFDIARPVISPEIFNPEKLLTVISFSKSDSGPMGEVHLFWNS